jgi:hypothetical protein
VGRACIRSADVETIILPAEKTEEYPKKFSAAVEAASDELLNARLLLPAELANQCEELLRETLEWNQVFGWARDPVVQNGHERKKLWDRAQDKAFVVLPRLLREIEAEARRLIHGEQSK